MIGKQTQKRSGGIAACQRGAGLVGRSGDKMGVRFVGEEDGYSLKPVAAVGEPPAQGEEGNGSANGPPKRQDQVGDQA